MWRVAAGLAIAVAPVAPSAHAATPVVAYARCEPGVSTASYPAGTRLGPLLFAGDWDGYADWPDMERHRDPRTGTIYVKTAIYAPPRAVVTVSIAPAYRQAADLIYGQGPNGSHVPSDIVRLRACPRRTSFFSGGLLVRGPTCVEIRVRARGSRRVYRKVKSIDMGGACPRAG